MLHYFSFTFVVYFYFKEQKFTNKLIINISNLKRKKKMLIKNLKLKVTVNLMCRFVIILAMFV